MSLISDVIVSGISLVCGGETPAVAKASTKFAIFKKKKGCSPEQIQKLQDIENKSKKIAEKNTTPCGPMAAFGIDEG